MVHFYYQVQQCGRNFLVNKKYEGEPGHYMKLIQVMMTIFLRNIVIGQQYFWYITFYLSSFLVYVSDFSLLFQCVS